MKKDGQCVLLVEDDPAILNGLLDVLVFNGFRPTGESDGTKGLSMGLENHYDLIVLDVMLPGMDGFSICRALREKKPEQAIVMLTAKGAEDDIVNGFHAGADDYISKPFSIRELMVRIEAVLRRTGHTTARSKITCKGILFDGEMLNATCQGKTESLTRKEMDIIAYLFHHKNRIVSKKELLTNVWHYADADIETRTVDIHILKLRKKITSLIGDLPFLETVRGEGYRLEPEE
ncbi:MAG: response regulator transcription factor [Desulfobacteraceae bacterium]|nr:response regulator transcription factor [Desulfobacteraceae bacterium]